MGREEARRLSSGRHFRQRLVLATLTSTAVTIEDQISDHHTIDLNETGKALPPAPPPPRA
jgi:RNA 3'-terminal phosphate cyclase-like protein